jgi:hypothetical protein
VTTSAPRFYAEPTVDDEGVVTAHAVVDSESGERVAYLLSPGDALQLASFLDALSSGSWSEDVLLGNGEHRRLLRRIELRPPGRLLPLRARNAGRLARLLASGLEGRPSRGLLQASAAPLADRVEAPARERRPAERRRRYSGAAK